MYGDLCLEESCCVKLNECLNLCSGGALEREKLHTIIISSSSLFVQIKIHDANKEHMIKPEQDSKVEKPREPHLLLPLKRSFAACLALLFLY